MRVGKTCHQRGHNDESSVNCLPCGVTVLSHVNAASDGAALNDSFEGPGDRVSWNLHIAMKLDLVGVNDSLEFCVVNLTVLHTAEVVAALLDRELLLSCAAGILNRNRPRSLYRNRGSRRNYGIFIMPRFGQAFVDGIGDDSILSRIHHV